LLNHRVVQSGSGLIYLTRDDLRGAPQTHSHLAVVRQSDACIQGGIQDALALIHLQEVIHPLMFDAYFVLRLGMQLEMMLCPSASGLMCVFDWNWDAIEAGSEQQPAAEYGDL